MSETNIHNTAMGGGETINVQIKIKDLLSQVAANNPALYVRYITEEMITQYLRAKSMIDSEQAKKKKTLN